MKHWPRIFLLAVIFLFGCLVSYLFAPNYLANILIVYTLPVALNFWWLKRGKGRIFIFALVTTVLFALPIELLSRLINSWDVLSTLPRLFGVVPLENLLYAFINFLWVLAFYEYFVDKESLPRPRRRALALITLYLLLFMLVIGSYLASAGQLSGLPYWQVGFFVLLIPAGFIFRRRPSLLKKVIAPTIFFALVFFIHEVVSMKLGHWWWPGEYLWPVTLLGQTFPLDDVIIWYLLSTPALIGGYEFFIDDYK